MPKTTIGHALPQWQEGYLDMHHISTGRGNAAFYILPDGTTLLVDAGDISEQRPRTLTARNAKIKPSAKKTAGQWIVDYIHQFHPNKKNAQLDYVLITHFHEDHMGEIDDTCAVSSLGDFRISGITQVAETIAVKTLIDRSYPDYTLPHSLKSPDFKTQMTASADIEDRMYLETLEAYWKFQQAHQKQRGMKIDRLQVGSKQQIILIHRPHDFADFTIRNIQGNGLGWTGWQDKTFSLIKSRHAGENELSAGIRISYGKFDYYTGGDISGVDDYGSSDMSSAEAKLAPVIGPVDAATFNHHGNSDSQSNFYVRTLRPKVWIQQSWSSDHPGDEVLSRIMSTDLYPGKRYLFANDLLAATKNVIGSKVKRAYNATQGHILIRVAPAGSQYQVIVLNDNNKKREVLSIFGPFEPR
ncbi:MAG: hypothetical protein GY874_10955 [Desulfobacteraceae bacterium]|nr:hypothetical protein [Desulfobacteraceae bacterium]